MILTTVSWVWTVTVLGKREKERWKGKASDKSANKCLEKGSTRVRKFKSIYCEISIHQVVKIYTEKSNLLWELGQTFLPIKIWTPWSGIQLRIISNSSSPVCPGQVSSFPSLLSDHGISFSQLLRTLFCFQPHPNHRSNGAHLPFPSPVWVCSHHCSDLQNWAMKRPCMISWC